MSADPYEESPFRQVSDMETPLASMADILKGISMIAETMDDDCGGVVQRLAWLALKHCDAAEKLRCELFRLTHPQRDHFEKDGWPGDEPVRMTGGAHNG